MLIEILISIFIGIFAGTITGLIPGIHINLVGAVLVGLSATIFSGIYPLYLILFIASMAIAHTFVDFIPSIFLGCPDTDTQLSVLPGHELLKQGRGYEAIMLTAIGGLCAVFILLLVSFPLAFGISKTDRKGFLILVGATNVLVMGFSFVSLYAISKTRTGAAVAIQQIIGTLSWQNLLMILIAVALSGIASFYITKALTKFLANKINKINYSILSIGVLILLTGIIFVFSGFLGLLVFAASTALGVYCNSLSIKKTHMMGCLLIPTMIYYFLRII